MRTARALSGHGRTLAVVLLILTLARFFPTEVMMGGLFALVLVVALIPAYPNRQRRRRRRSG